MHAAACAFTQLRTLCFSVSHVSLSSSFFFFFNDPATTEIYTLSLHDALPISRKRPPHHRLAGFGRQHHKGAEDRKSTRLNSSHTVISYAVFCLKKKKKKKTTPKPYTTPRKP